MTEKKSDDTTISQRLRAHRERYGAATSGYRDTVYEHCRSVADFAVELRDEHDWTDFCEMHEWNHDRRPRPPEVCDDKVFWVAAFMEDDTRRGRQRASRLATAVNWLLGQDVASDAIPDALRARGGLLSMAKEAASSNRGKVQRKKRPKVAVPLQGIEPLPQGETLVIVRVTRDADTYLSQLVMQIESITDVEEIKRRLMVGVGGGRVADSPPSQPSTALATQMAAPSVDSAQTEPPYRLNQHPMLQKQRNTPLRAAGPSAGDKRNNVGAVK